MLSMHTQACFQGLCSDMQGILIFDELETEIHIRMAAAVTAL